MNKFFRKVALSAIPCLSLALLPLQAKAWTTRIDCEGGTLNSKVAQGALNALTVTGTKTVYSTEQVGTGKQSCKLSIAQGSDGFPAAGVEWGGMVDMPNPVTVGQELWVRLSVYVPQTFQVTTNGGVLKFVRLHTRSGTTNNGCIDFWWGVSNMTFWDPVVKKDVYPPLAMGFEGKPENSVVGDPVADKMVKGVWETYEFYVKVDSVAKSAGGMADVKVWKNNKLISSLPNRISAVDKNGVIDALLLFTYWNGGSPATQSLYVDDLIMTTDRPTNKDAGGNAFIGAPVMSGAAPTPSSTAAPAAPSGISATPL